MRYQGKISKWIDDKGFGFITQDHSNEQVFVHISGFEKDQKRPSVGEVVNYEVAVDTKKGLQAYKVKYLNRSVTQARAGREAYKSESGVNLLKWVSVVALLLVSPYLFKVFFLPKVEQIHEQQQPAEYHSIQLTQTTKISNNQSFQCAGKTRCNEMVSCEEATFYLNNCPGTIADGDGDGIPCEDQWCGH